MASYKMMNVKPETLLMDLVRNPRYPSKYTMADRGFKQLVESLDADGFHTEKPLVVSERADGTRWLCQGHRRLHGVLYLRQQTPDRFQEIPCIVYKGLTLDEERKKLIDQFLVEKLSDGEKYLAIKQLLLNSNMTEKEIENHTGLSRGYVQRRCWIARAPEVVGQEWLKKCEGKEGHLALIDEDLQAIKQSMEADKKKGVDNPSGGPAFQEVWERIANGERGKPEVSKALTRNEMEKKASLAKDPIAYTIIRMCMGEAVSLSDVLDELTTLRAKAAAYDESQKRQAS